jgi:hypothetical protein
MSLLDELKQSLGPNALAEISAKLGTDPSTTHSAVNTALPVLLGALANNASTPAGASALDTALAKDHDGSALDNVSSVLSNLGGGTGGSILGHMFGARQGTVANGIGQATGLDSGKIMQLLAMLAPIVMGVLGKARNNGNLDAGGLASMLGNERTNIANNAPAGLGGIMGMLDQNHDGSVNASDVMGLASKFLGR